MFGITQRRFNSQEDFEMAWSTPIEVPSLIKDLGEPGSLGTESTFHGAVHFIAGYLGRFDFKLFRNGGQPLIERHTGEMREEIIIRLGSNGVRGAYVPCSVSLHVSHQGLRNVRERYFPGSGRAPIALFSGNVGLLQTPATYDLWNVSTEDSLSHVTDYMRLEVLPFLEMLGSPAQMRQAIFSRELPQLSVATSLEWLLLEFGHADARQFIRLLIDQGEIVVKDFWNCHDNLKDQKQIAYQPGEVLHNVAVIALSHDLCRRWLY